MKHFLLIGDPVDHSLSPIIHSKLIKLHSLYADYTLRHVAKHELAGFFEELMSGNISGFNVTMPHKNAVPAYADFLSEEVKITGSTNTIVVKNDGLHAYSTDADGLVRAFASQGIEVCGKRIGILGAGGVCLPLVYKFAKLGATEVHLYNRTEQKAQSVAKIVQRETNFAVVLQDSPAGVARNSDIFINTTSLGMQGVDADFHDLSFLELLNKNSFVCDLIYKPAQTKLLAAAEKLGLCTMNGLPMLIFQALIAFEHFTGVKTSASDALAVKKALGL